MHKPENTGSEEVEEDDDSSDYDSEADSDDSDDFRCSKMPMPGNGLLE